jgi:hypothetical protein
MKFIVQFVFLVLPFLANAQLERTWVAVESRQVTTDFISPLDGTIFDFNSTTLTVRNTFSDSTITHNYKLENDRITLNDSTSAVIKHLSSDSLLLQFDEWMLTVFYPLKIMSTIPELTNEVLLDNTWTLDFGDYQEIWNFTDIGWEMFPTDVSKFAVQREGDTEKWNVTLFKNFVILTLTMGQFDNFIYQVIDVNSDTVRLKPINKWLLEDMNFIKTPSLPNDQLIRIRETLATRTWNTTEIIQARSSSQAMIESMGDDIDSLDIDLFNYTGSYASDTLLISQQQLNDKLISYQFNSNLSYCILIANEEYSCGTWGLLKDGRTIKLGKGTRVHEYMDIVEITNDKLLLSNCNQFAIELGSKNYNVMCYTIELK